MNENNNNIVNRIINHDVPIYSNTLSDILRIVPDLNNLNMVDNILNESLYDKPRYKKVLCEKEREKILIEKIYDKNEIYLNSECPIYKTEFDNGDKIIRLPCNHCYYAEAIRKWLMEEKAECPVCRYEFKSQEIINTDTIINIQDEESGMTNELANSLMRSYNLPLNNSRWTNNNINIPRNNISLISIILNELIEHENESILDESLNNSLR
jgi:hypothetical protein